MKSAEKIKSRWTMSFYTGLDIRNREEKYICDICNKDLLNPSNLRLHRDTHVLERSYKCHTCQVSFFTEGKLQKHERSSSHKTREARAEEFGTPTTNNPRPYGCPECDVAFRKFGLLAKHLRSKSHILKMESNGLVPAGTYNKLKQYGPDTIVTTNFEKSLESLRTLGMQSMPRERDDN